MARSIQEIQTSIITAKNADATLSGLTSTSATAIWLLWTYVVAVCQWVLENLFDAHVAEVNTIIAAGKPHTLQWYCLKAKAFQYGDALPTDAGGNATSDVYAVIDETVMVCKYAAAVEYVNLVRIKTARVSGGALAPLTAPQLTALKAYMGQVKDAGVRLNITTGNPDSLQVKYAVYYDPTVLDATGARLDGTATTPVRDAIEAFLTALPFNGVFILNQLIAAVQTVPGVIIGDLQLAQANYAALPYTAINGQYVPDAGYMTLDRTYFDANVSYVVYSVGNI